MSERQVSFSALLLFKAFFFRWSNKHNRKLVRAVKYYIHNFTVHDEPREIQFWVANSNSSSFVSMAVRGHSLYRLNYPLGLKKWHHFCTSWNGKTGEWQLWIKAERVGRGFYNRVT